MMQRIGKLKITRLSKLTNKAIESSPLGLKGFKFSNQIISKYRLFRKISMLPKLIFIKRLHRDYKGINLHNNFVHNYNSIHYKLYLKVIYFLEKIQQYDHSKSLKYLNIKESLYQKIINRLTRLDSSSPNIYSYKLLPVYKKNTRLLLPVIIRTFRKEQLLKEHIWITKNKANINLITRSTNNLIKLVNKVFWSKKYIDTLSHQITIDTTISSLRDKVNQAWLESSLKIQSLKKVIIPSEKRKKSSKELFSHNIIHFLSKRINLRKDILLKSNQITIDTTISSLRDKVNQVWLESSLKIQSLKKVIIPSEKRKKSYKELFSVYSNKNTISFLSIHKESKEIFKKVGTFITTKTRSLKLLKFKDYLTERNILKMIFVPLNNKKSKITSIFLDRVTAKNNVIDKNNTLIESLLKRQKREIVQYNLIDMISILPLKNVSEANETVQEKRMINLEKSIDLILRKPVTTVHNIKEDLTNNPEQNINTTAASFPTNYSEHSQTVNPAEIVSITEKVYNMLEKKLLIEKERRGIR